MITFRSKHLVAAVLSVQFIMCLFPLALPALAQTAASSPASSAATSPTPYPKVNSTFFPQQILKSGVCLTESRVSPNGVQLANTINLTPVLEEIAKLRARVDANGGALSLESLSAKQDLYEAIQRANLIIQRCSLEIDFTVAEIEAEDQVYEEILVTFTSDRDKALARTNAAAFISNGALWAVNGALTIPGYSNSLFSIPSGIVAIPAGVVPSIASMWTLKIINGKKKTSEVEPNMLAKLFGYPTNSEIEYPDCVWQFLHQVPAEDPTSKKRLEQLIDRWISDSNLPGFTDRNSRKQLDVLTASVAQQKGLTINSLTARINMLRQLHAEIWKMKRMLLELTMAVEGQKQLG